MVDEVALPQTIKDRVLDVGAEVEPQDVDTYGRIREIEDKSHKLRTVLKAWGDQQDDERGLRREYAKKLIIAMFVQLAVVDVAFVAIGVGWLDVPETAINTFIISVFGEIAAMVFFITKYLFPKVGKEVLDLIEKL
jgi:hypothetical protein